MLLSSDVHLATAHRVDNNIKSLKKQLDKYWDKLDAIPAKLFGIRQCLIDKVKEFNPQLYQRSLDFDKPGAKD